MDSIDKLQNANVTQNEITRIERGLLDAPWSIKRLVLKLSAIRETRENAQFDMNTSVILYDITDNKMIFKHNIKAEHYAASVQKIAFVNLLLEDLRNGVTDFNAVQHWDANIITGGAGVYDTPTSPTTATVQELIFDLLNHSGNTANRVIVNNLLGGATKVNERLAQDPRIKVTRATILDGNRFYNGYTTAQEVAIIFRKFYQHNDTYTTFAKNALNTNIYSDYGVKSQVKSYDRITLTNKIGQLDDPEGNNRHDTGIVRDNKTGHLLQYVLLTTSQGYGGQPATLRAFDFLKELGAPINWYAGDRATSAAAQSGQGNQRVSNKNQAQQYIEKGRTLY